MFGRGRERKITATTDRLIVRKIKANRRISANMVKAEIEKELGIVLHPNTIQNRAHEAGLFGRVARKKPFVSKRNRGKRVQYAKEMLNKPIGF